MDRPSKRQKRSLEAGSQEDEPCYAMDDSVEDHQSWGHDSFRFRGQGLQNRNGNFSIGGDLNVITNTRAHNSADPSIERQKSLLESLRFDQIDARLTTIKKAHHRTCRWLLKSPQYADWLNTNKFVSHNGFLWIKGKPGAGKSTLMKFAFENARQTLKDKIIISFFLNASGEVLEKTTVGLYRSLLVQLLEARSDLPCLTDHRGGNYEWKVESLKALFETAVQCLAESQLVCFIDALDECQEDYIRDMVSFLSELATSSSGKLYICFASRYYPHITIEKGLNLQLDEVQEHSEDIKTYVSNMLKIGHTKSAEEIRCMLQDKAGGVFMWVVLVVKILNKEYDSGKFHKLRERLQELPSRLSTLFKDIITRDNNDPHQLLLSIQWILFARTPLTPRQLHLAVISGTEPGDLTQCHSDDMTDDNVRKSIVHNTKGLAEITKSKTAKVQFIHESVRDFLIKEKGLELLWPDLEGKVEGFSHEAIKRCCDTYLRSKGVAQTNLPEQIQSSTSKELDDLRETTLKAFPFFDYAVQNILYHADKAESNSINQAQFLSDFSLKAWVYYSNLFQRYKARRHSSNVSLLYLLAELNLPALIRLQPPDAIAPPCFIVEKERYGAPILAASCNRSIEAVQMFLEIQLQYQPLGSALHTLHGQYAKERTSQRRSTRDFTFKGESLLTFKGQNLLCNMALQGDPFILEFFLAIQQVDVNSMDSRGRTPLSCAAYEENLDAMGLLLKHGARIDDSLGTERTLLNEVVHKGRLASVRFLLDNGVSIDARDDGGRTPLSRATLIRNNSEVIKMLIDGGAIIDARDDGGRTPLSWAASTTSSSDATRLLLENGADVEARDEHDRTPLSWAVMGGNDNATRLLLESGANAEARDKYGQTPLFRAASYTTSFGATRLLLESGADVEARDEHGRTPLSCAASTTSSSDATKLLLESGADAEARDEHGRTPLSWAASDGWTSDSTRCLLERGADVEARDEHGRTPLSWAASCRFSSDATRLLLESGADLEARDEHGRTPLSWAVVDSWTSDATRLLLESGANVEARDEHGRTPLSWAASDSQFFDSTRLLLESGADVEARDKDGQTPLLWAVEMGHFSTVEMLIDHGANIDVQAANGQTVYMLAEHRGSERVRKLLQRKRAENQLKRS